MLDHQRDLAVAAALVLTEPDRQDGATPLLTGIALLDMDDRARVPARDHRTPDHPHDHLR